MRKWIRAGLGLLLVLPFAVGADAQTERNKTVASGTGVVRIQDLRGGYKMLAIKPYTQDVIVTVYDNGSVIETFTIEGGGWRSADISGRDSVQVARATATKVDWGISTQYYTALGGGSASSNGTDSLVALASVPEQRTTSQDVLINQYATSAPTATIANCIGVPVSGCRALLLDIEWDATTTDFAFEYMFGISAADSTFNKLGAFAVSGVVPVTGIDTLMVDESDWPDNHFTMEIPLGGSVAAGYFYCRIYAGSVVAGLDVVLYKVW